MVTMKVRDIIAQNPMLEEAGVRDKDPRVIVIVSGDSLLWRSGSACMRVIA